MHASCRAGWSWASAGLGLFGLCTQQHATFFQADRTEALPCGKVNFDFVGTEFVVKWFMLHDL